ncbi:MAG: hypothetical protein JEZ05_01675 [Tenericutes bacterium]|nr:hypothetical protein [Mycoplasmatota bacterium]
MDDNIEFHQKKMILDELYKAKLVNGFEWAEALSRLINEYDSVEEINSQ